MQNQKIPGGNELLDAQDILKNKLNMTFGSSVADLGCGGVGFFVFKASQIVGKQGKVFAVDVLKSALSNIEARAKLLGLTNIKTIWSNLEKHGATKINNNSLDYALLINVLFQNKNHADMISEATRTVKSDGKLLIVDWNQGRFPIGPKPEEKVSPQDMIDLAEQQNLQLENQFQAGKFHYGLVFKKQ